MVTRVRLINSITTTMTMIIIISSSTQDHHSRKEVVILLTLGGFLTYIVAHSILIFFSVAIGGFTEVVIYLLRMQH